MKTKELLYIAKYNKNIKTRLDININNYIEYSEKYSFIEIEIKIIDDGYSKFINIYGKEKYYHIYFNNSKEEIKRNYIYAYKQIKLIKIIIDYQVKSFDSLFHFCKYIESIYFKKFCRNDIDNMDICFLNFHH